MREPAFWWRAPGLLSTLWAPAASAYGAVAARRLAQDGARTNVPLICVGNFTLGGAGKTPTAIALAAMLQASGEKVFLLSRGYGGSETGPRRVDAHTDAAAQVGDEALLLALAAPTIVSRDRAAGARLARAQGATVIVMDDGLQNPSLAKDFTLTVIDGRRGIGNGKVFPAGPLRAPLPAQLARTDALLLAGGGDVPREIAGHAPALPVFRGRLVPDVSALGDLKARQVLAFAGIGDPEKFFVTVAEAGIAIAQRASFPDHHRFTAEEAAELSMRAEHDGLALLTTEKDRARMAGDPLLQAFAARLHVLPVTLRVNEMDGLRSLVLSKLGR
jgi:tetraacyldisaccharide 4'-kinase